MEVRKKGEGQVFIGSALIFLATYIAFIIYTLIPYTVDMLFGSTVSNSTMTEGWSGWSESMNTTIVQSVYTTAGSAFSIALVAIMVLFAVILLGALTMGYKAMR